MFFLCFHRLCNPIGDSSRKRIYSSPVLLHFHSDESLTHKGFYLIYRAFSPESGEFFVFCFFFSIVVLHLEQLSLLLLCDVSGPLKVKHYPDVFVVVVVVLVRNIRLNIRNILCNINNYLF